MNTLPFPTVVLHAGCGWLLFLLGVVSGAALGIFFHREEFLGGYGSERRRLLRLGHIACFGMGLVNLSYAGTVALGIGAPVGAAVSGGLLLGAIGMPLCCVLMAIDSRFRYLFPVPVVSLGMSIGTIAVALAGPSLF